MKISTCNNLGTPFNEQVTRSESAGYMTGGANMIAKTAAGIAVFEAVRDHEAEIIPGADLSPKGPLGAYGQLVLEVIQ